MSFGCSTIQSKKECRNLQQVSCCWSEYLIHSHSSSSFHKNIAKFSPKEIKSNKKAKSVKTYDKNPVHEVEISKSGHVMLNMMDSAPPPQPKGDF